MPRRAFTLIELLVVIGIMITLMSLIMGGVMLAKRSALRAKTVSSISALASAIDQYRSLNNTYPELLKVDATSAKDFGVAPLPGEVYGYYFSSGGATKAVTAVQPSSTGGEWGMINQALVYQLGDLIREQAPTGMVVDAWKTPLRYRPAKWYKFDAGTIPRIDSENPPGQDSYQLWSAGLDTKDDATNPGEGGDDIPQWAKQ